MKIFLLLLLINFAEISLANIIQTSVDHQCFLLKSIQTYNIENHGSLFLIGLTKKFSVTKAEHENPYEIDFFEKGGNGKKMGMAKVDTGTLLNGKEEYLGLMKTLDGKMARAHRYFTTENEQDIIMTNIDLQCDVISYY